MSAPTVHESAAAMYRTAPNPGLWPYRGKVAVAGVGHSPTMRRWDGDPSSSIGAWAIVAIRRAIEDAGVDPAEVDGLVLDRLTSPGSHWAADEPIPEGFAEAFQTTSDPMDGLSQLSAEWVLANVPELSNVKFVMFASVCMSMVLAAAVEAVGRGMSHTCLAVKGWHNFAGRYNRGGVRDEGTVSGPGKYVNLAGPASFNTAIQFQRYLHKYGKSHDMMAPFVVNSRANGLLFPEGYWAQHRPEPLTVNEYLESPWICEPASLLDNDLPIHTAAAYLITTAERAVDLRQKPVYVLGHAGAGTVSGDAYTMVRPRSVVETLEEAEENAAETARKLYQSAGVTAADIQFENCYDGFTLFHVFHIEGFGFAGIERGEALDLFQEDISIHGPHPVSPSGGNIGGGRTRFWMHTDSIQQLQGRAGARQMSMDATCGISGGFMPFWSNFFVWSSSPQ